MTPPAISACMIVKNEEKMLPGCLKSIQKYVDEIVIVDTGSTDRTVEIAASFGARIYYHLWENNFSKHRNQSFGYARGDWILYIDADEELMPGSGEMLQNAIQADEDVDAISVTLECIFDKGGSFAYNNAIRVFRNHRGLHYAGRVHNYIVGVKKVVCEPIRLFHHGYALDKNTMKEKFERTTSLLKKDIAENPDDPRPRHFLAAAYLSERLYLEAATEASEAIRLYEKQNNRSNNYLWSLYIAASAQFSLGDIEKSASFSQKGIQTFPHHMDAHYMMALVAYVRKDRDLFEAHMARYLKAKRVFEEKPEAFGELVHNTFGSEWFLYLYRGFFLLDSGNHRAADAEFKTARGKCPQLSVYHSKLGSYYKATGLDSKAEKHYLEALALNPQDPDTLWGLSELYETTGRAKDQKDCLDRLLAVDPDFPNARFNLGLVLMSTGDLSTAASIFTAIRRAQPDNRRAKINEALCMRGLENYRDAIRLSEKIEPTYNAEKLTLTSHLALCYYAIGEKEAAGNRLSQWADMDPRAMEPLVYLSKLCVEKEDIEMCVQHCDRLLTLLGVSEDRTLNRLEELGELFFKIAGHFSSTGDHDILCRTCCEIAAMLGYKATAAGVQVKADPN